MKNAFFFVFRGTPGIDWICSFWRSAWLPEKEPWIEWHLLQRPGYHTTNKSDVTAADEVCLANRWWHELPVIKICKLINKYKRRNLILKILCRTYRYGKFFFHTYYFIFLPFGLGLFLQGALFNFQRHRPCFFFINIICGCHSSCSLADVLHPRLILVSLTPIKFSIVNSLLIIERKFSPFFLETVTVLMHFNLLLLGLIRNMLAIDFARCAIFRYEPFSVFSSFNYWFSLLSQSIPLDHPPRPCSP